MEKDRGFKIVAIVALVIGVLGLSIGFAAFTATLNIQNFDVTVDPINTFEQNINYVEGTEVMTGTYATLDQTQYENDATGTIFYALVNKGTASEKDWTGIEVTFRKPTTVTLSAQVKNESQWDGYLKSITSSTGITCTPGADVTEQYVNAICSGDTTGEFTLTVDVNGFSGTHKAGGSAFNETCTANNIIGKTNGTVTVTLTMVYAPTQEVDGEFTIHIPTISFDYSTAPTVSS